jgi:hypothetical protein
MYLEDSGNTRLSARLFSLSHATTLWGRTGTWICLQSYLADLGELMTPEEASLLMTAPEASLLMTPLEASLRMTPLEAPIPGQSF